MQHLFARKPILLVLTLGFAARLAAVAIYGDFKADYYWEYGEIARSMLGGDGYSYFVTNDLEPQRYTPGADPAPSAYLPPGYVAFLLPFMAVDSPPLRNWLLYLSQIGLSLVAIALLYRLTLRLFDRRIALLAALVGALLPEFLYAVLSFTPTVLYHLLVVALFLRLFPDERRGRVGAVRSSLEIGLLLAAIVYLRSEFLLFAAILIGWMALRRQVGKAVVVGAVVVASILPWTYRNYRVFDTFVPMTTSFGLNLYRGHNPDYIGSFGDSTIVAQLHQLDREKFEIGMNGLYRDRALSFAREHPGRELLNAAATLLMFWTWDPNYAPSLNPLYAIPNLLLSLLWVAGLVRTWNAKRYGLIYLWFFASLAVVVAFFGLPRYGTMMKILTLPFAAAAVTHLYNRFRGSPGNEIAREPGST